MTVLIRARNVQRGDVISLRSGGGAEESGRLLRVMDIEVHGDEASLMLCDDECGDCMAFECREWQILALVETDGEEYP